jgi:hypothetical protein
MTTLLQLVRLTRRASSSSEPPQQQGSTVLRDDGAKARRVRDWGPRTTFDELIQMMIVYDIDRALRERTGKGAGVTASARGAVLGGAD